MSLLSIDPALLLSLPSGAEWITILIVVIVLFGGKKIPELMRGVGKGIREFNSARSSLETELKEGMRDEEKKKKGNEKPNPKKQFKEKEPFKPQRFPTFFKAKLAEKDGIRAMNIPRGTEKTIKFDTDVENNYFDRIDEPGKLKIALLSIKRNSETGGEE